MGERRPRRPAQGRGEPLTPSAGDARPDQLELVPRPRARRRAARVGTDLTQVKPIAQVVIDSAVPHLDRVFDYAIPAAHADLGVGSRVRVRFSGRLTNGFVIGRLDQAEHGGTLRTIERVLGAEPVLTAETITLVQHVAERYAGTFSDVARAAVPPRHARAEAYSVAPTSWQGEPDESDAERWTAYEAGPALFERLGLPVSSGTRAVWSAAPATSWARDIGALVTSATRHPGGGVIVVVPDATDVERVLRELGAAREAGAVAVLTADQGPERRYREFLRVLRGAARIVVGTRAAVFAPVRDLRLLVVWDDGDDALADPQAPYWDAREVAALRSHLTECDLVVGSGARSVASEQWCETGWAHSVLPTRATIAARGPRVRALSTTDAARDAAAAAARIPHYAWQVARRALDSGAVLVQVARKGYLPALACQSCRALARCSCAGPLQLDAAHSIPRCGWCGKPAADWRCPRCGSARMRAVTVGAERTAEEVARAFPGVRVISSHAGHVVPRVGPEPALVVATPGAEPECDAGYHAVLILDARMQLQRPALDAGEDALRRWFAAARLAIPGGSVVVTAENSLPAVQALLRWDAPWFARRELQERTEAGLPPAVRMAALFGAATDILEVSAAVDIPHRLLGPMPAEPGDERDERQRGFIAVDRHHGQQLGRQLRAIVATRSARSDSKPVHVQMDPRHI